MKTNLWLALGVVGAVAGSASAGPWTDFSFGPPGDVAGPFTITTSAAEPALDVTDAFLSGDRFRVRVSGVGEFDTSVPTVVGDSQSDYDACFADPRWSSGTINLGVGTFTFDILILDSPFGGGGAAYRTSVPAPASLGLLGAAGLIASRRRR